VIDHGNKTSQCDGMTVSESGDLYLTMLRSNAVVRWPTGAALDSPAAAATATGVRDAGSRPAAAVSTAPLAEGDAEGSTARTVAQDPRLLWPDTFGWASDSKGGLLVTSARLEGLFLQGGKGGEWSERLPNVRIFRVPVEARSYQHALGPVSHVDVAALKARAEL
jgi:hypothetical protein